MVKTGAAKEAKTPTTDKTILNSGKLIPWLESVLGLETPKRIKLPIELLRDIPLPPGCSFKLGISQREPISSDTQIYC